MLQYQIRFSRYALRDYEKKLAIKEFENQFPSIKNKSLGDCGISFVADKPLDETKLKKLAFYSMFHYQNAEWRRADVLTDQTVLENYQKGEADLVDGIKPHNSRDIRYFTHSFHEYKGRFYPQLAKALMNYAGLKKGDTVLDPFCGSGTTLVESLLFGVNAVGVDINPIAYLLSKAKVESILLEEENLSQIEKTFGDLEKKPEWRKINLDQRGCGLDMEYLKSWFPENNLKKIIFIQQTIRALSDETSQLLVKVILSNMLREFSYQDPKQLRIRRRLDKPPHHLLETFKQTLFEKTENLKKFRMLNRFKPISKVDNYLGDVRTLMKSVGLKKNSIDAVITSPPYATALPYVDTDRLSLFAFGYTSRNRFKRLEESLIGNREITKTKRDALNERLEKKSGTPILPESIRRLLKKIHRLNKNANVGFRRKNTAALLYQYFLDMHQGIGQVSQVLKKNKLAFFVVGNNRTTAGGQPIDIPTSDFVALLAECNDFRLIEKIPMTVQKGYLIHTKNSINAESIMVLQRR